MTTEVCPATNVDLVADTAIESLANVVPAEVSMVESVASVVSGISVIGWARDALQAADWTATIAANRITIDDAVEAQLIPAKIGTYGLVNARWIINSIAGTSPVWVVGAGQADASGS